MRIPRILLVPAVAIGILTVAQTHRESIRRPLLSSAASVSATVVGAAPTPGGLGYRLVTSTGAVSNFGSAVSYGSMAGRTLAKPIVAMATTPTGKGYWLVASDGGVFGFGDAGFYGSLPGLPTSEQPTSPVIGMASTSNGKGYWLVTSAGDVYSFGDAAFYGSMGAVHLNKPVVGVSSTPNGKGYWLVASDGGIFAFGDAGFAGSMGATPLNRPIVAMSSDPSTGGYWLVASDGGIFAFGAPFYGSLGGQALATPIVAMTVTTSGIGYRLVEANGDVSKFGNSPPTHSGGSSSGGSSSTPYGDGILPPANPPANITPNPDFLSISCTSVNGGPTTCNNPCYTSGASGAVVMVHDPACSSYVLEAINNAHAQENIKPIVLPSNWQSLTAAQRLFMVAGLERIDRGLPPYLGLVPSLNAAAQSAANANEDPSVPSGFSAAYNPNGYEMMGGTWAGGGMTVLMADYEWMYNDGWGGSRRATDNFDCTSATAPGCWAHRDELLGSDPAFNPGVGLHCTTCLMGTAAVSTGGNSSNLTSLADLLVKPANAVPAMSFTWAQEVSFLPGQQSANITSLPQAVSGASGWNP